MRAMKPGDRRPRAGAGSPARSVAAWIATVGLGAVALLLLATCSGGPGSGSPGSSDGAIPPVSTAPPPASSGQFNAVHAAAVLQPAVGMVIIPSGHGTTTGSGFVIASQGGTSYMVTNNHVVEGAGQQVQVLMPDGRHFSAQVHGADPLDDVAVLKVGSTLPVAQLADSNRARVGEPAMAIGSPLGNAGTVTVGVISALHRSVQGVSGGPGTSPEDLSDVLQTDAPINPGSSGGPLADGNGRVVGMTTAGNENASGIGYAIPSLVVRRIAGNLIEGRPAGHPYLGVCYKSLEEALASGQQVQGYGVLVTGTVPDGPADKVEIRAGDMIEKVDGVNLNNGQTLAGVLQLHNPGDTLPMTVSRNGSTQDVRITVAERPSSTPSC